MKTLLTFVIVTMAVWAGFITVKQPAPAPTANSLMETEAYHATQEN